MALTRVFAGAVLSLVLVVYVGETGNTFGLPRLTEEKPWVDPRSDQLPAGAVARLGTVRFQNHLHGVCLLAFSPDGKQLACNLFVWEVATGKVLRLLPRRYPNHGHQQRGEQVSHWFLHAFRVLAAPFSKSAAVGQTRAAPIIANTASAV
jgi:hypothetical protein